MHALTRQSPENGKVIRLAETDDDILSCHSVLVQLRPHVSRIDVVQRVRLQSQDGYRLAIMEMDGEVVAVAGFRISHYLAWGKALYVDDLVTAAQSRSKGYGQQLLEWLEQYAREQGCQQLHLDSGVTRHDAHRFYLSRRMKISSYHFMIALE